MEVSKKTEWMHVRNVDVIFCKRLHFGDYSEGFPTIFNIFNILRNTRNPFFDFASPFALQRGEWRGGGITFLYVICMIKSSNVVTFPEIYLGTIHHEIQRYHDNHILPGTIFRIQNFFRFSCLIVAFEVTFANNYQHEAVPYTLRGFIFKNKPITSKPTISV